MENGGKWGKPAFAVVRVERFPQGNPPEINDDLDALLREKQIREGDFFKEKDQEEIIPGMPGYKFAEEEETNEIGEDDLPF